MHIERSRWYDAFFHVLAHVAIPTSDASTIHDEQYRDWVARAWIPTAGVERTLVDDAALIARLWVKLPNAFLLNLYAILHDDVDDFMRSAATPFAELRWPQDRERVARLIGSLPASLVEIFRVALWAEIRAGYADWSLHQTFDDELPSLIARAAKVVPALGRIRIFAVPALTRFGRVYRSHAVCVGTGAAALGVPTEHVVVQACHEAVLGELAMSGDFSTSTADGQYAAHLDRERAAARETARIVAGSWLEDAHRAWLRNHSAL